MRTERTWKLTLPWSFFWMIVWLCYGLPHISLNHPNSWGVSLAIFAFIDTFGSGIKASGTF